MLRFRFLFILPLFIQGCVSEQSWIQVESTPKTVGTHHTAPEFDQKITPAYNRDIHHLVPTPPSQVEDIHHEPSFLVKDNDLWERIRDGFELPHDANNRVIAELRYFARHPNYIQRVTERGAPYLYFIVEEVERRNMPTEIALLPIVESAFQVFAYSHGRAAGIWQFIPGTGKRFGLKQNWWYDGRRDIYASTHAALDYLQYLHEHFDGDWMLALAAYNSGEGTVNRAVRRNKRKGLPTDFWSLDLPRETQAYVPKLIAISEIVLEPEQYNAALTPIDNRPYVKRVDVGAQVDLAMVAELAGISIEDVYLLNPGFNRWATDPQGPHNLFVPHELYEDFQTELNNIPKEQRIKWARYKIKPGDSISVIAKNHHTTAELIKDVNHMNSNRLRAGQYLIIPVASKNLTQYALTAQSRATKRITRNHDKAKTIYTVRNGDSFWSIAKRHGVSVRSLAAWNGMAPRDTLKVGQKLVVLGGKSSAVPPSQFTRSDKGHIRRIQYTVRKGDSIATIASRFRVSINDVVRWNKLNKGKYLQPGQKLTLFVDVTKQSGRA